MAKLRFFPVKEWWTHDDDGERMAAMAEIMAVIAEDREEEEGLRTE
jgi:hypothetical protein